MLLAEKVSGTKVETTFSVTCTVPPAGSPPGTTWNGWQIKETPTVKFGTEADIPGLPAAQNHYPYGGDGYATGIRWASTHFNHASNVRIESSVSVRGVILTNGLVTQEGPWHELRAYVEPQMYNVGRAWATRVDDNNHDLGDSPPPYTGPSEALLGCGFFNNYLPESKHLQATGTNPYRADEVGVNQRLYQGTFIHADTHGSLSGLAHSNDKSVIPWAALTGYLFSYLQVARNHPLPNIVAAFACQTVTASNLEAAKAFQVVNPTTGATIGGKAYAGFANVVFAVSYSSSASYLNGDPPVAQLSKHAKQFYASLADGLTVEAAAVAADATASVYMSPIVSASSKIRLMIKGDKWARINSVYRSENQNQSGIPWYLVLY